MQATTFFNSSKLKLSLFTALFVLFQGTAGQAAQVSSFLSPDDISDAAERVTPAVVNITTRTTRRPQQVDPFFEFFGPRFNPRPQPQVGAGSGVVVSPDGQLVTNNHVVEGAEDITVTFADGREYKAKLIGADKPSDLAFLKIDVKNSPYLKFGDSSKLRLGQIVLAVGNPFGVGQTVTMGIVSAKGRASVNIVEYEDFIQTDASINPGNSGGALVNLSGELVGINTAILSPSRSAAGIGFAVPSNMVVPIREQIIKGGKVRRGWLGVEIQDLDQDLADSFGVKEARGVLVTNVIDGGPADRAGIKTKDVIVDINGSHTESSAQLRNRIALLSPGTKAKVTLIREGKKQILDVALDERSEQLALQGRSPTAQQLLSGLAVEPLTNELKRRLDLSQRIEGVIIRDVDPDSPSGRAGLEQGDVITAVGTEPIRSPKDFYAAVPKNATKVRLRVFKGGRAAIFVILKI